MHSEEWGSKVVDFLRDLITTRMMRESVKRHHTAVIYIASSARASSAMKTSVKSVEPKMRKGSLVSNNGTSSPAPTKKRELFTKHGA